MKIEEISVTGVPPLQLFEAGRLKSRVVVAGPNGVGKTVLLGQIQAAFQSPGATPNVVLKLTATSDAERNEWQSESLTTNHPQESQKLRTYLQRQNVRSKLRGSVIVFQSNRSIQTIQPLAFQWDLPDPDTEPMNWNFGFTAMTGRFQDVRHSLFRKLEAQKRSYGEKAIAAGQSGEASLPLRYRDPLADFKRIFAELLPGKTFVDVRPRDQEIIYEYRGSKLDFSTLSSGEREMVVTAFDFRLRNPEDCVVLFDEPELHLHPEMTIRFLRVLQTIGQRNQFILTTHSPDVISSSLEDSVLLLQPPARLAEEDRNQALNPAESEEAVDALRDIGQSLGVVALGRKIVLIEGTHSSLDRETYNALLGPDHNLVLLPSGGVNTLVGFDRLHEEVISKVMWGVDFFAIRDRDIVSASDSSSRVATLSRYHLENYFLDEDTWSAVFEPMTTGGDPLSIPGQIRTRIREEMEQSVGYAAALRATTDTEAAIGALKTMPKGVRSMTADELADEIRARFEEESERIRTSLNPTNAVAALRAEHERLSTAIAEDNDAIWKQAIPAREALHRFIASTPLKGDLGAAKRLYIAEAANQRMNPFQEILDILEQFRIA